MRVCRGKARVRTVTTGRVKSQTVRYGPRTVSAGLPAIRGHSTFVGMDGSALIDLPKTARRERDVMFLSVSTHLPRRGA